jgi:hypothetical protein
MKKTIIASSIVAVLAMQTGVANAQSSSRVDSFLPKGAQELSFSAQLSMPDEGDDNLFLFGSYGFSYTDNIQAKLGLTLFESGGTRFGTINPGADYIFNTRSEWIPYAGGSYGLSFGDFDSDFLEVHGGAKKFLGESLSVFGELRRSQAIDTKPFDSSQFVLLVGVNIYLE